MKDKKDYDNRLFQILKNETFSSEFIAGIAGDRIQDPDEKELFDLLLKESGSDFYVKLLFFITHEVFEKEHALKLWKEILNHKKKLTSLLGRNVEITVATLDYLTNIKTELSKPKIIGEAFIGKIAEITSTDPLTKIFNRQHLKQVLEHEYIRFQRYNVTFSILLIDIDKFKTVNDTYGHQEGDHLLIKISELIIEELRSLDVCTRYGGDEFLLILPHTNSSKAYEIGERIRKNVESKSADLFNTTLSIGVASCSNNKTTIESLIKTVDEALYISKKNGRNLTTVKNDSIKN